MLMIFDDIPNATVQQLTAMLKQLDRQLTREDHDAVGVMIGKFIAANPLEGEGPTASARQTFAALSFALTTLRNFLEAQAVAKR